MTRNPIVRTAALATLILALSGALVACGDDEPSGSEAAAEVTAAEGISQALKVKGQLFSARSAYARGNAEEAAEIVEAAYLEHFEIVEIPLDEVDHELNEELEHGIREDLVEMIEAGAPKRAVEQHIRELDAGLNDAIKLMKKADDA